MCWITEIEIQHNPDHTVGAMEEKRNGKNGLQDKDERSMVSVNSDVNDWFTEKVVGELLIQICDCEAADAVMHVGYST